MFKNLLIALGFVVSVSAQANTNTVMADLGQNIMSSIQVESPFSFKVGDTASYKINMGFLPATMVMTVKNVTPNEVTISQVIDMMGQKQDCVQVMDPNTGETKSLTCNGQAQNSGDARDLELIEKK